MLNSQEYDQIEEAANRLQHEASVKCSRELEKAQKYKEVNDMEIKEKLKHWFHMVRTNKCLGCCLFCEWWDMCKWETEERRKKK